MGAYAKRRQEEVENNVNQIESLLISLTVLVSIDLAASISGLIIGIFLLLDRGPEGSK